MDNKKFDRLMAYIYIGIFCIFIFLGIVFLILRVYALINYGDLPLHECPSWAIWILKD